MHFGLKWVETGVYVFSESFRHFEGGTFRNSQLAQIVYTHFLKIQIVLIIRPFKQTKSLLH